MYKHFIRKILFLFDPESVHNFVIFLLRIPLLSKILRLIYHYHHPSLYQSLFGLSFPNPVGLAAGFDKGAKLISQMADVGFGFLEIGTVTPQPQSGNPKPRIFRLVSDEALINRMGFNNDGIDTIVGRLKQKNKQIIIAGNIGKNKTTPNEKAGDDYLECFTALYDYVDFFVVNVSSPNTPGLRELQDKKPLTKLLQKLQALNKEQLTRKPILLKIAPDLNEQHLDNIIEIIRETKLDGIVATNTTIARENLKTSKRKINEIGEGGLSGIPLRDKSTEIIRYINKRSQGNIPIIGVGGIHRPEDAIEKLKAGASLVELYTGFIYEGPSLIKKINKALVRIKNK